MGTCVNACMRTCMRVQYVLLRIDTGQSIYNLEPQNLKVKRRILIKDLESVSLSKVSASAVKVKVMYTHMYVCMHSCH